MRPREKPESVAQCGLGPSGGEGEIHYFLLVTVLRVSSVVCVCFLIISTNVSLLLNILFIY